MSDISPGSPYPGISKWVREQAMPDFKRRELGDFLRVRRSRLTPEGVGLPHRRRRTPGLRREEVAELAGIGVDWYIRLEQGRSVTPSINTVDALARALRLSEFEHQHLRALAGGDGRAPFQPETVSPAILHLLESLPHPATSPADAGIFWAGMRRPPRSLDSASWRQRIGTSSLPC